MLIIRLAVLAEAVADLRQSQQHAAQAAGALRAAQQLHAARGIYAAPAAAGQRPGAVGGQRWPVPDSRAARPPGPGHAGTAAAQAVSATQTRAAATTPVNNNLEGESDGHL